MAEKRVVDTRGGAAVNIEKYNEKFEDMAGAKNVGGGRNNNFSGGKKEKIGGKNKQRQQAPSSKRRQEEKDKFQKLQLEIARKQQLKVEIPDEISVGELASRMKKTASEVIKQLMKLGVFASVSEIIDYDTAALVAMELGCKVEKEVIVTVEERLIDDHADAEEDLRPRAPVVVVMGHVDHGKTSLLDYIRHANVVSGEAGGITQHIGAYTVEINGSPITFLDTPGHEAFTSMRARGAMVTDIAILVVAADDGIMPQTVESINHAKAANIPVVVAINKMDTVGANPERIKQQLTEYDLVSEEWGGDTIVCPISAKTGMGIENLLENLVVLAEVQELRANPNRAAKGTVIEARLDKGRGPIMTVLVQNGTLKLGDIIIAGTAVGRVRTMINDKGQRVTEAGPSTPVEISGMSEVPSAGDTFNAVNDERMARELAEERRVAAQNQTLGTAKKVSLEDLFSQIQAGEMKTLNLIVKADVQGSAEAVKSSLEKISNDEVRVKVIHSAVGAINESDVMLAATSGAIIVGFNVRPDNAARDSAARSKVDMRMYRVIYDCIEEIESAMKGMLAPKFKEVVIGHAEVRETYKVSKVGTVCGCYCTDGKIQRGCEVRVLRDNIVIHEGDLASLRRFKDDVKEVAAGYECGMQVEKFNDIKVGDVIECFVMEQIKE
ncbi:MAG: translation initiation factor IF-2 [Oscillospiraceae bacterium]|nr:translation initiation factor IF-2 [Oscillospiraceae bacterium]